MSAVKAIYRDRAAERTAARKRTVTPYTFCRRRMLIRAAKPAAPTQIAICKLPNAPAAVKSTDHMQAPKCPRCGEKHWSRQPCPAKPDLRRTRAECGVGAQG
jgi:hypothetical protein